MSTSVLCLVTFQVPPYAWWVIRVIPTMGRYLSYGKVLNMPLSIWDMYLMHLRVVDVHRVKMWQSSWCEVRVLDMLQIAWIAWFEVKYLTCYGVLDNVLCWGTLLVTEDYKCCKVLDMFQSTCVFGSLQVRTLKADRIVKLLFYELSTCGWSAIQEPLFDNC